MRKTFLPFLFVLNMLIISGQESDYTKRINSLYDKGYNNLSAKSDSALYYFDQMQDLAQLHEDWFSVMDAISGKNWVAQYRNDLKSLNANLIYLDSIFKAKNDTLRQGPDYLVYSNDLNYQRGNYFYLLNDFNTARKDFNQIVTATELIPDSTLSAQNMAYLTTAYAFLAKMNAVEGKLDQALEYYDKNVRYLKKNIPEDKRTLYTNYSLIAEIYKLKGIHEKANDYLLKTLKYNIEQKNQHSIATILNIVQNHNSLQQIDSASYYLNIAHDLLDADDPALPSYYQVQAETYWEQNKYEEALTAFDTALELEQQKWEDQKQFEVAHILNKIGRLQKDFNENQKAIERFNEALTQLSETHTAVNQRKMVEILKNKASAENKLQTRQSYKNAMASVEFGIQLLDSLKPAFKNTTDKSGLIEDTFPLFESGLEATFQLFTASEDPQYIDQAFQYAENSKAALLMDALLNARATQFGKVPQALLERENQLKYEIASLEKQQSLNNTPTTDVEDQLFVLKTEYRTLIERIEAEYPEYYDLKYSSKVLSIANAQQLLKPDELLISYFYGETNSYAIAVSKDSKQFLKIMDNASLENQIRTVSKMLGNPKSEVATLATETYSLYKKVLHPLLQQTDKKRLLIIADGLLNYIPFGSLNAAPEDLTYLIEEKAISYANSATLWAQLKKRPNVGDKILAFAPSFESSSEPSTERSKPLLPLPNNTKEVSQILTSFKGDAFLNEEATLSNFNTHVPNHGMLHLATHAIFDDATPENSYLAFAQEKNEASLLYVRDLYNLSLTMDMVTLSACETGIGTLKRGEGFISLARGFFYSGASSITSTLWKVNDASSTKIMDSFYKNLSEGDTKDLALQRSKKIFLETNDQNALAHPYYWSGFIVSGNTASLVHTPYWMWAAGFLMLSVLIGAFFYFKNH